MLMTLVLAPQGLEILHRLDVHQRARQKGADADVDRQAALDSIDDPAVDDLAGFVALLDLRPDLHPLRFLLRENDMAFGVLGPLQQNLDVVAYLDRDIAVVVHELVDRDQSFGLVADVDNHMVGADADDMTGDNLPLREMPHALVIHRYHFIVIELGLLFFAAVGVGNVGRPLLFFNGLHENTTS
jgi:hypothetical protein